ncbi:MAG: hypothetical protein NTY19_07010 [Planctomycetota bacterium]|nr:hypothetical protein [Planctomycetota bacterium]
MAHVPLAALVVRLSASADTLSATSFSWWEPLPDAFPGAGFSRAYRAGFQRFAGNPPVRLSDKLARFKSYTARRIIDAMEQAGYQTLLQELQYFKLRHKTDQTHQLWQAGSHPEQIQNEKMMWQKLEYIHNNPLRRGYVDDPTHWRYSSARNYAGQPGLIDIVTDWR